MIPHYLKRIKIKISQIIVKRIYRVKLQWVIFLESLMVIYDATIIGYQDLYLKTGTSPLACPGFYIRLIEYNLRPSFRDHGK